MSVSATKPHSAHAWRLLLALASMLVAAGAGAPMAAAGLQTFPRGEVTIVTADGGRHDFTVEEARTPAQRSQGLMYRPRLAPEAGMLFIYEKDWPVAMWMKNTRIPLDMLFIARDGRIAYVAERAVPYSLESISAGQPVAGVLEINGGSAARLGIAAGDRVIHPAFAASP